MSGGLADTGISGHSLFQIDEKEQEKKTKAKELFQDDDPLLKPEGKTSRRVIRFSPELVLRFETFQSAAKEKGMKKPKIGETVRTVLVKFLRLAEQGKFGQMAEAFEVAPPLKPVDKTIVFQQEEIDLWLEVKKELKARGYSKPSLTACARFALDQYLESKEF